MLRPHTGPADLPSRELLGRLQAEQAKQKKRSKKALREASTASAVAAKKPPARPPPPAESEESSEEEEEEAAPGPRIMGYAGGAFETLPAGDAAGWEFVSSVGKKKGTGARGSRAHGSAVSQGGGSASRAGRAAAPGKKRAAHACERPGCGAIGSRRFKKCGR